MVSLDDSRNCSVKAVFKNRLTEGAAAEDRHNEQLDASQTIHDRVDQLFVVLETITVHLESTVNEQQQLTLALKSFLKDKSSKTEVTPKLGEENLAQGKNQQLSAW
jgi:hypothetical protein